MGNDLRRVTSRGGVSIPSARVRVRQVVLPRPEHRTGRRMHELKPEANVTAYLARPRVHAALREQQQTSVRKPFQIEPEVAKLWAEVLHVGVRAAHET